MSDITDWIKSHSKAEDYFLTDSEYYAVTDFVEAHKDEWKGDLGEGLLKLLNGEMHRRIG